MNVDIVWGRALQIGGWLSQLWGMLTDDDLRRMRGYQLVAVGQLRVLGGRAASLARYCTPRQVLTVQPERYARTQPRRERCSQR